MKLKILYRPNGKADFFILKLRAGIRIATF